MGTAVRMISTGVMSTSGTLIVSNFFRFGEDKAGKDGASTSDAFASAMRSIAD